MILGLPYDRWQGVDAAGPRQKFTGKERDAETGLDFFEARYHSSAQGRFTSPDPLGGHTEDPQTLNRYSYVRNNPLRYTDPTGLDFYLRCSETEENKSTCQGGYVGITDQKGNFNKTRISNDKNGNLVDQAGNRYGGQVDSSGVRFTQNGSDTSFTGLWISGSNDTRFTQTSGALSGFSFQFYEPDKGQTAAATFSFPGTSAQAGRALQAAGYSTYFFDIFNFLHPSTDVYTALDFRSPGAKGAGAGSGHFTLFQPLLYWDRLSITPSATVPVTGTAHFGEHNPWVSIPGLIDHTGEVLRSLFRR